MLMARESSLAVSTATRLCFRRNVKGAKMSRLRTLTCAGQSVWLDFLSRPLIRSGGLRRLIDDHGVSGVTSNPSIFARAMVGSDDYDRAIRELPAGMRRSLDVFYEARRHEVLVP